jgi:DNA-binding CsgD family transcriptional regulator
VAIIGDLTDLSLSELLSLISLRAMSGQLVLQRRDDDAVLEFKAGHLVRVVSSRVSQPLGELLVQRGTLTPQHLAAVLEQQTASHGTAALGTLLLEQRPVTRDDLEAVLTWQAREILTRVLAWPNGTFAYLPVPLPMPAVPLPQLNITQLTLEGLRQADETDQGLQEALHQLVGRGMVEETEHTSPLTRRELAILEGVARGLNNAEIAQVLALSPPTVKNYLSTILSKLGVPNRTQAVVVAVQQGWLQLDSLVGDEWWCSLAGRLERADE